MRAVVITEFGEPDVLKIREVPTPVPVRGEVRVKVKATGVNRADLSQRMGKYPPPPDCPQDILGLEFAGVIDAIGDGAGDLKVGDRVFGLVGGGSYAEYVVVHNRTLTKIPDHLNFVDAAAIPEVFMTAYDAMVTQAGLVAGDTVLISAVGSGVGTAALQIVNALGGRAIGTSRTAEKLDGAKQHGLHEGILVKDGKFADEVLKLTDGKGVDIVLERVGGAYVEEDILCMVPKGRLMMVGLVAGAKANLDLGRLLANRLDIRGTTMRKRPLEEKIDAANIFSKQVIPLIIKGDLKPIVAETFPLKEAAEAHRHVQADKNFGKVVLIVDAE
ncbi:MAG: NAD(P)H-quinone oxidoreductase [Leptolyngbya sp.]|nr:NAD(P)H-quinone oxidoreductase [Candidatus Melainabacteria bacterium]